MAQKLGIWSLFISIWFKIDQIVLTDWISQLPSDAIGGNFENKKSKFRKALILSFVVIEQHILDTSVGKQLP